MSGQGTVRVFEAPAIRRTIGFADLIEPVTQAFEQHLPATGVAEAAGGSKW